MVRRVVLGASDCRLARVFQSIWSRRTDLGTVHCFLHCCFAADAGDVAEEVSESAAEDVAFVGWHLQRFLDGVGESVLCEAEVLEHKWSLRVFIPQTLLKSCYQFTQGNKLVATYSLVQVSLLL